MSSSIVLLQRIRVSGKCPLSLLSDDRIYQSDNFDSEVLHVLGPVGKYFQAYEHVRSIERRGSIFRFQVSSLD